jgi:ubiquinone/menaquinone biosynthesis C-methylase UbiE
MTSHEAERHKAWVAAVFDRAAPTYDRVGAPYHDALGRRLVELAGIRPGAAVLDVACGRGAVLVPARQHAGPSGRVVGVDISVNMLNLARAASADAELCQMDAERLGFAHDSFDVVLCAFALPFLPSPQTAVAEFARVVRQGGVVGVTTWAEDDPDWSWLDQLVARTEVSQRPVARPLHHPEDLTGLLVDAGLGPVRMHREEADIEFADPGEWWRWIWSFSLRGVLEQLDAAEVEALRRAAGVHLAEMRRRGPLRMRLTANVALAGAPSTMGA